MSARAHTLARALVCGGLALMGLLYSEPYASGNGRFPKADMLVGVPGSEGRDLYLRSTFGVLVSHDAGKKWEWICEEALGFSGTWDPPIAVTRSAVLYVGLQNGLRKVSKGCEGTAVPELAGEPVSDVSVDGSGKHAVVVTSPLDRAGAFYREGDDGKFDKRASLPEGYTWDTVDVAPSSTGGSRVYMTGVKYPNKPYAHFLRSNDGGKTFEESKLTLPADGRLFLSGIDPNNVDRVFVRQIGDDWTELLLSTDGGTKFESVLHTKSSLLGFALSPDGKTAWAAAGDPKEGLYRSDDGGLHFSHVADASLVCLHANKVGLFGCSNPMTRGGPLLFGSSDRGVTVSALSAFSDIRGPASCQKSCGAAWAATEQLVLRGAVADVVPQATTAATTPVAVMKDAGGAEGALQPAAAPANEAPKKSCGCDAQGGAVSTSGVVWVAVLLSLRRRRAARAEG